MVRSRIDPIPPAAIRGPRTPALLKPERDEHLSVPIAEITIRVARGHFDQGKGPDLGTMVCLSNKAVFGAQLGISKTVGGSAPWRVAESRRRDHVQLEVRVSPVIHFHMRSGSGAVIGCSQVLRSEIDLPMLVCDGFRVVRKEWRTRKSPLAERNQDQRGGGKKEPKSHIRNNHYRMGAEGTVWSRAFWRVMLPSIPGAMALISQLRRKLATAIHIFTSGLSTFPVISMRVARRSLG